MKIKTLLEYFNFKEEKKEPKKSVRCISCNEIIHPESQGYDEKICNECYFNFDNKKPVSKENRQKQTETDVELKEMLESKEQENQELIEKNIEQLEKDVKEVDEE